MNHTLQRLFFLVLTAGPLTAFTAPQQAEAETIEDCLAMAEENFPLVRRYDLVTKTEQFTLSNIVRGWLPQVSAYGQATYQSAVVQLPAQLEQIMAAQGTEIVGINPLQYRAGVDVQQTVYDGGATAAAKEMARAQAAMEGARNDVDIYSLRERVNGVFFGWLLVEERLRLNAELQTLLSANVTKLEALLTGGVAMGSDVDAVRAELATARQQQSELEATRGAMQRVLTLLCGREITSVTEPEERLATTQTERPEMHLFDTQLRMVDAQERSLRSRLMPKLGLFAQGYYGYTGLDMYRDMFHRSPTLNGIVGARLTWNISALYTHNADKRRLATQRDAVEVERETWRFNQQLLSTQEQQNVLRYRRAMADDDEIVKLRSNVRRAAEAKLAAGIIDTNALLQEITRENQAAIQRSIHRIEYLKALYEVERIGQ